MTEKPCLFIYPGKIIIKKFQGKEGFSIINQNGWLSNNLIEAWDDDFSINSFNEIDYSLIVDRIKERMEIWSRWVSNPDQYQLLIRDALFHIIRVIQWIKKDEIKFAIFSTSLPHHIDTSMMEIACSVSNTPMIFLYGNVIDGRLLPMLYRNNVTDRVFLESVVSNHDSADNIKLFLNSKISKRRPKENRTVESKNTNYYRAILYLTFNKFITGIERIIRPSSNDFLTKFIDHGYITQLKLIKRQRKALEYYQSNVATSIFIDSIKEKSKERLILFAAHFQPEATSFPEGWDYSNNIDIILKIRSCGYKGVILYKEHHGSAMYYEGVVGMTRVGIYRSRNYYKQLIKLGCVFLPLNYDLLLTSKNDWYLPVTITGTIALERSLFGLESIVSGYPWYKGIPGVTHIDDFCVDMLIKDSNELNKQKITAEKAFIFMKNVLNNKTIVNAPGISTGIPLAEEYEQVFLSELREMISFVKKNIL